MKRNVSGENLCVRMEKLIEEFEQSEDEESTEIGRQFAQLQRTMMEMKETCPCIEGAKVINRPKNRYKDVLPYDDYRVILGSDNESDYINASFVQDFKGNRRYIAAQGPIDESLVDFIRMIWEYQITTVICTANEYESGRLKFRRYWPSEEQYLQFGTYRIIRNEESDKAYRCSSYEIRPLIITQGENSREILLYHFLNWFDHDIPDNETSVFELLSQVEEVRIFPPETPILIHCSAGCGRTGSLIAIDLCRLLIREERLFLTKDFETYPIFTVAKHIRQFRIALIQTLKQYLFVYKMFVYMLKILMNNPSLSARCLTNAHAIKSIDRHLNDNSLDQPPPIPPRQSLLNTTNKNKEGQFVRQGEVPVKSKRTIFRSRNVRRRDPPMYQSTRNNRSDSADNLDNSSNETRSQYVNRRVQQQSVEQDTYSD